MVPITDLSISVKLVYMYGTFYNKMWKICEPLEAIWMHTSFSLVLDP